MGGTICSWTVTDGLQLLQVSRVKGGGEIMGIPSRENSRNKSTCAPTCAEAAKQRQRGVDDYTGRAIKFIIESLLIAKS